MPDDLPPPAAHENASADTRSAAKWLIAAFAGVAALLLSGIGLATLGDLDGTRLIVAVVSFLLGTTGVIVAVYQITEVLTPSPVTLADLARYQQRRNDGEKGGRNDDLVAYIEADPTFLQGIVDSKTGPEQMLITASARYREVVDARFRAAESYWKTNEELGTNSTATQDAKRQAVAAGNRAGTMHTTVRRLERIGSAQQTVLAFRKRRGRIAGLAIAIAISIGLFALASNPPEPPRADLRGAVLDRVDLSGASLREANLEGMTIRFADLGGTNLEGANVEETVWIDTVCPDGTNSDNAGGSCAGHLDPGSRP